MDRCARTSLESGLFGGGTIGYNMQRGAIVFGIEADFGAMNLSGNKTLSGDQCLQPCWCIFPYTGTANSNLSTGFYGDVTGRLGWAWGPWMLYGKGGLAVLEAKTGANDQVYSTTSTIGVIGGNPAGTNYPGSPGRQPIMNRASDGRQAPASNIFGARLGA